VKISFQYLRDGAILRWTKVEWWDRQDFTGRAIRIRTYNPETFAIEHQSEIPFPDSEILCDFCNARIEEFPVPVVEGYALCKTCQLEIGVEPLTSG